MKKINFIFGIHNHQPIGNFDFVFEDAIEKSYKPFLEVLKKYPEIKIMIHFSGCLIDWIEDHHPEYFDLLHELIERDQVELLGSGYYEPILTIIPEHDRYEQIKRMSHYIRDKFKQDVKGIWLTERVWEPHLPKSLVNAGVKYIVIDDYHLKSAGMEEDEIDGYFSTEEEGYYLSVFPISEKLRYMIPFAPPEETIEYMKSRLNDDPSQLVVMIDDGEKFGVWPNTYNFVYKEGWLENFFRILSENREWLEMRHCSEFMDENPPRQLIYMPNNSYFEMGLWALPAKQSALFEKVLTETEQAGLKERYKPFLRGGVWRNFLTKYPEINLLHKWMLKISNDLNGIIGRGDTTKSYFRESREHLLKSQCNCPYWHGVFGGLYLPHLRHAVFSELVNAQKSLDNIRYKNIEFLNVEETDIDCDGNNEIILNSKYFSTIVKPSYGGSISLLSFKENNYNLGNTLKRRYEYYHDEIIASHGGSSEENASIHNLNRAVSDEMKENLAYDWHYKYSLLDHFFGKDVDVDGLYAADYEEQGDFVNQPYDYEILNTQEEIVLSLLRKGHIQNGEKRSEVILSKNIYLNKKEAKIRAVYKYKNNSENKLKIRPGVEWNFFLLGGEDTRKSISFNNLAPSSPLDQNFTAQNVTMLTIQDLYEKLEIDLRWNTEGNCWIFPVKTISQSEGGYDLIYQGSTIIPNWEITLEAQDEFTVVFNLIIKSLNEA